MITRTIALLLTGLGLGAGARVSAAQVDPGGRKIDIGGYALHLRCVGSGAPTVVFEAGAGSWSVNYVHLQDAVARTTRACTYDRAGLGLSDPGPLPRTSVPMADELYALLERAGEAGPFVLVGHSLGGYNVRVFASRHPESVAGVVLLESAHEEQFQRLSPEVAAVIAEAVPQFRAMADMARAGRPPQEPIPEVPAFAAHPELREVYASVTRRPEFYEASAAEMEGAPTSAAQAGASAALGDLPLVVVTAGRSFAIFEGLGIPLDAANAVWLELQSELLDLSTDATQLVAPDATHQIDWDAPELAIDAVLRVVRAARRGTRMAAAPSAGGAGHQLLEHWDRYLETINAKALDRLMEFFSADAILMPPSQPAVYGVDGARAWFGALFAEFDVELAMPTLELMLLGDRAVRRGTYEVSLTPNAEGPRSVDRGKFIQVWERQGEGVWRIVRGMLNSDLPTIETVGRE